MRIGLLQAGHLPEDIQAAIGDYPELYGRFLAPEGIELETYPVVDGVFPESPGAAEGWLISGSRHGVYEPHDWIPPLETFVRDAIAASVPVVGICFGHQLIAQALGGRVEKFSGGWAVGHHVYDWRGEELPLNAWHQDQVVEAPGGAEVLASSPFCANAAFVYGRDAFSVQAHPEFNADATGMLIDGRGRGVVPDPILEDAKSKLDLPVENTRLARRIANFFRSRVPDDQLA